MKKLIFFASLLITSAFVASFVQAPTKEMEKNIRQAYKELLKETDKNKDGKMSKDEFYAIWKDKKVAEKNYKAWDTNKDGFIVEDEYVKAILEMGKKK
jgi:Ca2+-binding EF-hand superfamily protein